MTVASTTTMLGRLRSEPLRGPELFAVATVVWIAGGLYCAGYELFARGENSFPGCLIWSTFAALPWLALFEWSKSRLGRELTANAGNLALLLVGTAIFSLALEAAVALAEADDATPLPLALLRRLPGAGISFILILWARPAAMGPVKLPDPTLAELASTIDRVSAADNYVELHIGGRVTMRRMTLAEAERALSGRGFVRIHRRYLVKADHIRRVHRNGTRAVVLDDGTELPIGRAYEPNLAGF